MKDEGSGKIHSDMLASMGGISDRSTENYVTLFPEELIVSILDSFIINRPMTGGVGGDGFWVHQGANHLYLVVFDCMGHGHLASIMTRQYTNTLKKVITQDKVEDPGEILTTLHAEIQKRFASKKDPMIGSGADVGIVKLGMAEMSMEFAGAKMELYKVTNGEMEVIKGDRFQVGDMFEYEHKYTTVSISFDMKTRSCFYLSSDGFKDLLGGESGKKLGRAGLKEMLEGVYGQSMLLQKESLQYELDQWSKYFDPLDDTLILGFAL